MALFRLLFLMAVTFFPLGPVYGGDISATRVVSFHGEKFYESRDFSGVASVGKFLVVCTDEGNVIQVLERTSSDSFSLVQKYSMPDGTVTSLEKAADDDPELDLEGVASDGNTIYIVGSHSQKRSRVDPRNVKGKSRKKNRERLTENEKEPDRMILLRFRLDEQGRVNHISNKRDLFKTITGFDHISGFFNIPSKENGIDIEGIATKKGKIYIGFRGPVLRENWVPVLVTEFQDPEKEAEIRYVNLGGLGIRDMVSAGDQIFLIGGPVGDGPGGYHLFSWNGKDCIPGKKGAKGEVLHIGEIPTKDGSKAEGVAVLPDDKRGQRQLLVVYDGPERGAPILLKLKK